MRPCPCNGCEDRQIGCHGKCERYNDWKKERAAAAEAKQKADAAAADTLPGGCEADLEGDAQVTDREKVVEGLKKVWNAFNAMEHELYADYVFDALELLNKDRLEIASEVAKESILMYQGKQIVRCKECKHRDEATSPYWEFWCKRNDRSVDGEWFCADGEVKDDG